MTMQPTAMQSFRLPLFIWGLVLLAFEFASVGFFLPLRRTPVGFPWAKRGYTLASSSATWCARAKNVRACTCRKYCIYVGGSSIAWRRMNRLDFSVLAFGLTCLGPFPPACHDAQPGPWTTMILHYRQWLPGPKRSWNRCLMRDVGHLRLGSSLPLQSLARAGAALSVGDPPFWSTFSVFVGTVHFTNDTLCISWIPPELHILSGCRADSSGILAAYKKLRLFGIFSSDLRYGQAEGLGYIVAILVQICDYA